MIQSQKKDVQMFMTKSDVRLHQNNARAHTTHIPINLINQFERDIITHVSYSPNIALNDYHLFPKMKKQLDGTHFATDEKLKKEVLSYLFGVTGEFYDSGIKKIVHRRQKFIIRSQRGLCRKIWKSPTF